MATNYDFGRPSLLIEQYQREMDLIAHALQEESQDEVEERLRFVERAWPLTCACFQSQGQLESSDTPVFVSVSAVRP